MDLYFLIVRGAVAILTTGFLLYKAYVVALAWYYAATRQKWYSHNSNLAVYFITFSFHPLFHHLCTQYARVP